jgi:hypothetical protein
LADITPPRVQFLANHKQVLDVCPVARLIVGPKANSVLDPIEQIIVRPASFTVKL